MILCIGVYVNRNGSTPNILVKDIRFPSCVGYLPLLEEVLNINKKAIEIMAIQQKCALQCDIILLCLHV